MCISPRRPGQEGESGVEWRRRAAPAADSPREPQLPPFADGIGTPDPNPKHLVNWCFEYSLADITYIVLNWLSGALAGVGSSDFIAYSPLAASRARAPGPSRRAPGSPAANLRTKILDFGGFDSSRISISRDGILMPIGDFLETLSRRILAGIILVGRLEWPLK